MEFLNKAVKPIKLKIQTKLNAQTLIFVEIVQEFKVQILIIREIVGLSQDIKFGKSNNMEQSKEYKK